MARKLNKSTIRKRLLIFLIGVLAFLGNDFFLLLSISDSNLVFFIWVFSLLFGSLTFWLFNNKMDSWDRVMYMITPMAFFIGIMIGRPVLWHLGIVIPLFCLVGILLPKLKRTNSKLALVAFSLIPLISFYIYLPYHQIKKGKPNFEITEVHNQKVIVAPSDTVELYSILDKPSVIVTWYSGCGLCKMVSRDVIHPIYDELKDKVNFFALNGQESWEITVNHQDYFKSRLIVGLDFQESIGANYFPTTLLLGTDGKILYRHNGYMLGTDKLLQQELRDAVYAATKGKSITRK